MMLAEAQAVLIALRPRIEEFLVIRADLAELRADLAETGSSPHGALADAKALEARLYAELEHFSGVGAQVKGFAPLLLDIPGERAGMSVLWCCLRATATSAGTTARTPGSPAAGKPDHPWHQACRGGWHDRRGDVKW